MERLPLETQTVYAELLEQLLAVEAQPSLGRLRGAFVTKAIKGETYYYFQHSRPGGTVAQTYVGKRSPAIERLVARFEQEREELAADRERIDRLAALARTGGVMRTDAPSVRVLRALADSGLFAVGAVLVGTHAFVAIGNALGVRWTGAAVRTHDLDIARTRGLDVAVPDAKMDLPGVLERLNMGFLPVPPFDPRRPSTSFKVRGQALRVDVLTPGRDEDAKPVRIDALGTAAQPLRYLDYLVEAPERAIVIDGSGVLVNVPQPARFALHKLVVATSRPAAMHTKAEKDVAQAAEVLRLLLEERPGDLPLAWEALVARGRRWRQAARVGMTALRRMDAALARRVSAAVVA